MKKIAVTFILGYLSFFAKIQLLKFRPIIVAVGGASGKTSLANFISIILSKKFKVLETKGKNSETGIPLSILDIKVENYTFWEWLSTLFLAPIRVFFNWQKYDVLVAEMGIDGPLEPKNMSYLLKIVKPKIGVLTNIALEHSEYFNKKGNVLDQIAEQELLLLKSLPKDGNAFLNLDDIRISKVNLVSDKITISSKKKADFFIRSIKNSLKTFEVSFVYNNDEYKVTLATPLPKYYAFSIVASLAISQRLGFSIQNALQILQDNFSLPSGRFSIFKGIKETDILDSSYNSSPVALKDALELLSEISGNRRRLAILGDMRELGRQSKEEHQKLADLIIKNCDFAILIGPNLIEFTSPVLQKEKFAHLVFSNFSSAKSFILREIKKNDLILVKGSQNTLFLERVVELLLKNKSDVSKLARRGKFWDKIRSRTP